MPHRVDLLGTDLSVFPLGFGTADFGTKVDQETSYRLLDRYAEAGGNFLDSAHVYAFWIHGGLGVPERIIGEWARRSGVHPVIATKGGHPDAGSDYPKPVDFLARKPVAQDIAESLDRLQVDQIDIFYLHRDDGITPVSEIIDMLNEFVDEGLIQYLGASNWSVARVAEANEYALKTGKSGFVIVQPQWSLAIPTWSATKDPCNRYIEDSEIAWYQNQTLTVSPYSATANGYFAQKQPSAGPYDTPANRERFYRATSLAAKRGVTPTQIALAWLRSHPFPVIPLFSTGRMDHLEEALGSTEIKLLPEEVSYLRTGA